MRSKFSAHVASAIASERCAQAGCEYEFTGGGVVSAGADSLPTCNVNADPGYTFWHIGPAGKADGLRLKDEDLADVRVDLWDTIIKPWVDRLHEGVAA